MYPTELMGCKTFLALKTQPKSPETLPVPFIEVLPTIHGF